MNVHRDQSPEGSDPKGDNRQHRREVTVSSRVGTGNIHKRARAGSVLLSVGHDGMGTRRIRRSVHDSTIWVVEWPRAGDHYLLPLAGNRSKRIISNISDWCIFVVGGSMDRDAALRLHGNAHNVFFSRNLADVVVEAVGAFSNSLGIALFQLRAGA